VLTQQAAFERTPCFSMVLSAKPKEKLAASAAYKIIKRRLKLNSYKSIYTAQQMGYLRLSEIRPFV